MSFEAKCSDLKKSFQVCASLEARYQKIMEMGKNLPPFPPEEKQEKNIVFGCQSLMYLSARVEEGRVYFNADSGALISKGLAALLFAVYNGELLETVAKLPPTFLGELGLSGALSPSRSNGLLSLYLKMKEVGRN